MPVVHLVRVAVVGSAVFLLAGSAPATGTIVVTESRAGGWFTNRQIFGTGTPGDTVTVTFSNGTKRSATVGARGTWFMYPGKGDGVGLASVNSILCPTPVPFTVAGLFDPPNNAAFARHTVGGGSTATVGGSSFSLAGRYTATALAVDYDPLSPTYGLLSGTIGASDFVVTGSGAAGEFRLALDADQPFAVDLRPIFPPANPDDPIGTTTAFNVPVAGTVTFNGAPGRFRGTAAGTSTYGADGAEAYSYLLDLQSDFGRISGSVNSAGTAELVPAPGGGVLLGVAALTLLGYARRRRFS